MIRKIPVLFFALLYLAAPAQVSHFVSVREAAATNKQITMGSYMVGYNRILFTFSGGIASGTDYHFLSSDQLNDNKAKQKINSSLTIDPQPYPFGTYLEECDSKYSGRQARLGFTVFLRRNDTLGRTPFTGPHIGLEAVYMTIHEDQRAIFKSETDDSRTMYTGSRDFYALGAATHLGWQFGFFKGRLYLDLRAVIPFYYPFMEEPNLNSPFAGTKYEFEACLSWRFVKRSKAETVNDEGKTKVRTGI